MPPPIIVKKRTYRHWSEMMPAGGLASPLAMDSENRQSFFPGKKRDMPLRNTAGAYVTPGGHNLLLVIDLDTVQPGSDEWRLIAETAAKLEDCWPRLSAQGKAALKALRAVVFSAKPLRSYAEVRDDIFFYDTDEFRRQKDGTYVSPSWTASCVVHDANHVWQHQNRKVWHGVEGEVPCWRLQIENRDALGLTDIDVGHLQSFIDDPEKIVARAKSKTHEKVGKFKAGRRR